MSISLSNPYQPHYLLPPNTVTQTPPPILQPNNALSPPGNPFFREIKPVVPVYMFPWQPPTEHNFASQQVYQNPNAGSDGVVRIDSELSSSDVVELDDTKANPEDVAQEVEIAPINPGETAAKSLTINLGAKDSLRPVEASVTHIEARGQKLTLSFMQTSSMHRGSRDIKISFPERSLEKITKVLDIKQKYQLLVLLKKDQNKGTLAKFLPNLLESLGQKASPKTSQ